MNVCSYHLQEAGATPVQELSFALATASAVLDTVRASGEVDDEDLRRGRSGASRSSSTPACASSPRSARCAPSRSSGTRSPRERYGVTDPKKRIFRYGVQVNSLGLTEQQPENNVHRILLEMLAVTLSQEGPRPRRAAAGLERGARPAAPLGPAMVAAHAADPRLRDRPPRVRATSSTARRVIEAKVEELKEAARARARAHRRHGRRDRGGRDAAPRSGRSSSRTRGASPRSRPASRSSSASTASRRASPRR